MLNIFNEIGEEDKTIENLKKDCPDKYEKIKEIFYNCIGENYLESLETEFRDNEWKYLNKKITLSIWIL